MKTAPFGKVIKRVFVIGIFDLYDRRNHNTSLLKRILKLIACFNMQVVADWKGDCGLTLSGEC